MNDKFVFLEQLPHFVRCPIRRSFFGGFAMGSYGELSAKTRQLIQENTTFVDIAESLPVFKIDKDYVTKLDELPTPADKAAALEAILTRELSEDVRQRCFFATDARARQMVHWAGTSDTTVRG